MCTVENYQHDSSAGCRRPVTQGGRELRTTEVAHPQVSRSAYASVSAHHCYRTRNKLSTYENKFIILHCTPGK